MDNPYYPYPIGAVILPITRLFLLFIQPILPPQRRKELSPTLRARICELRYAGWSYGEIAIQVSRFGDRVSQSTVQTTCNREIERVDNASKPRSGRPRVITEEERDQMYDIVEHDDPFIKWRDLACVCETAHERSVRRVFADMHRRKWRCYKRLLLPPAYAVLCIIRPRNQVSSKHESEIMEHYRLKSCISNQCHIL